MNKLLNGLSIRASVRVFIGLAVFNAAALGCLGFWQSARNAEITELLHADVELARAVGMADMMHDGLRATVLQSLLTGPEGSDADKDAVRTELTGFTKSFAEAMAVIDRHADDGALRRAVAATTPVILRYKRSAEAIVTEALMDRASARILMPSFMADFDALAKALEAQSELIEQRAALSLQRRDAVHAQVRAATGAAVALTVLAVALFGLQFGRTLLRRLGAEPGTLREFANRIAAGELHTRFDRSGMADGSVAAAMVRMRDELRELVSRIREGADGVASGTQQIASGNHELSARTERQAARLQQAASSMEQMSGSVRRTADHASVATRLAEEASRIAQRGGESVQRMVATMDGIQGASHRIAEIIGTIDGIAFQTNILALNAAVEAARAGEQGRGFAVVAAEVRSLAQRSATAAKEIKSLIDDSVERVDSGHRVVVDAGNTMREIVDGVQRVTGLIGEIRHASGEQTDGIAMVTRSVSELDGDTQGNAALVEETAAAAGSLHHQAVQLAQMVSAFKLAEA